ISVRVTIRAPIKAGCSDIDCVRPISCRKPELTARWRAGQDFSERISGAGYAGIRCWGSGFPRYTTPAPGERKQNEKMGSSAREGAADGNESRGGFADGRGGAGAGRPVSHADHAEGGTGRIVYDSPPSLPDCAAAVHAPCQPAENGCRDSSGHQTLGAG